MLWRAVRYVNARASMQLRVLGLGFFQDGDVGVGIFPEGEEIFVSGKRTNAGGIGIRSLRGSRLQGIRTREYLGGAG